MRSEWKREGDMTTETGQDGRTARRKVWRAWEVNGEREPCMV